MLCIPKLYILYSLSNIKYILNRNANHILFQAPNIQRNHSLFVSQTGKKCLLWNMASDYVLSSPFGSSKCEKVEKILQFIEEINRTAMSSNEMSWMRYWSENPKLNTSV